MESATPLEITLLMEVMTEYILVVEHARFMTAFMSNDALNVRNLAILVKNVKVPQPVAIVQAHMKPGIVNLKICLLMKNFVVLTVNSHQMISNGKTVITHHTPLNVLF